MFVRGKRKYDKDQQDIPKTVRVYKKKHIHAEQIYEKKKKKVKKKIKKKVLYFYDFFYILYFSKKSK